MYQILPYEGENIRRLIVEKKMQSEPKISASLAFEKFKNMEVDSHDKSPVPGKISKSKRLISDLSNKFESPRVKEERKKRENKMIEETLARERDRQRLEDIEKSKKEEERIKQEKIDEEVRAQFEAAERRRAEREARRAEEEKKYAGMKPVQAMFEKSISARRDSSTKTSNHQPVSGVSVSDIKNRVKRRSISSARNSLDIEAIQDLPIQSVIDVYTKGNLRNLKDKFEAEIRTKRDHPSESISKPLKKSAGLPDMFEQQKKREETALLNKQKENIPTDKKVFEGCLNKFEEPESRKIAKNKLIELTIKQKSKEVPRWKQREEEKLLIQADPQRIEKEDKEKREQRIWLEEKQQIDEEEHDQKTDQKEEDEKLITQRPDDITEKKNEDNIIEIPEKKKVKKVKKKLSDNGRSLPTLASSTFSDMKKKLQEKSRGLSDLKTHEKPAKILVRKLKVNPFEGSGTSSIGKSSEENPSGTVQTAVKLNDLKKRFNGGHPSEGSFLSFKSKKPKQEIEEKKVVTEDAKSPPRELNEQRMEEECIVRIEEPPPPQEPEIEKDVQMENSEPSPTSKEHMQNYLLSQLLFDKKTTPRDPSPAPKNDFLGSDFEDDTPINIMDDPYFQEIEKYLSLLENDGCAKKAKKKKASEPKKTKKKSTKLKVVEVNDIKSQFEKKKNETSTSSPSVTPQIILDKKVNKFKEMFETQKSAQEDAVRRDVKRRSRQLSDDILSKFDCPEMVEKLKKQREEEREVRRISRLQKLEEEQRRLEEEARLEIERLEAERIENERLKEEERLRLEEEARIAAACEEMMRHEKEKAEARRLKEELLQNEREKNEPALKKKKVLGRIKHIFEKGKNESEPPQPSASKLVGSIKGKAEELFLPKDDLPFGKTPFQDSSLTGMSVNKFKDKFENDNNEQVPLLYSKGEKKRRVPPPIAVNFEKESLETSIPNSSASSTTTEWSWKKKDQSQLAVESTMALIKTTNPSSISDEVKKARSSNSSRLKANVQSTDELLKELQSASERLSKKDALLEHEVKMKEYAEFIDEIQNYLNEPIEDISLCLEEVERDKKKKKKKKTLMESSDKSIEDERDWKYSKLKDFIRDNEQFVPPAIKSKLAKNMNYKEFVKVVDQFLNAPDRSVEEIEFKDRIEALLDMIDEDSDRLASTSSKRSFNSKNVTSPSELLKNKKIGPDITLSCSANNKSRSSLPDVVTGGNLRRDSINDGSSTNSSMADFQSEMRRYLNLIDSKENKKAQDAKWKIGKVDASFLFEDPSTKEDTNASVEKRAGQLSDHAKEMQDRLKASLESSNSATTGNRERKKKVIVENFVTKNKTKGIKDLQHFLERNERDLPNKLTDFSVNEEEFLSRVREYAKIPSENETLRSQIKIYLGLIDGPNSSVGQIESVTTDRVSDLRKNLFESKHKVLDLEVYSAPKRKLVNLEIRAEPKPDIPKSPRTIKKWTPKVELTRQNSNPRMERPVKKSASDAAVNAQSMRESLDPREREAAILAKYGIKPRPDRSYDDSSSSSSESEDEEEEDIKDIILKDARLKAIYGERLLSSSSVSSSRNPEVDSVSAIRNILGAIRQNQVSTSNSAKNLKSVFEEESTKSHPVQKSMSFANIKSYASKLQEEDTEDTDIDNRPAWRQNSSDLMKSSSFHKFKTAFERNNDDDEESFTESNTQVKAELEAIRSCSRLQRLFAINKPSSSSRYNNPSTTVKPETVSDISQARDNIKSAFESTSAKISYGVKLKDNKPQPSLTPKPSPPGKKWVYDTINKYFDVIVEDEESDDEEDSSESESEIESEEDVEIEDFSTIIAHTKNSNPPKSTSSPKIRSLLSSVMVEKSISTNQISVFKSNLCEHLKNRRSIAS